MSYTENRKLIFQMGSDGHLGFMQITIVAILATKLNLF